MPVASSNSVSITNPCRFLAGHIAAKLQLRVLAAALAREPRVRIGLGLSPFVASPLTSEVDGEASGIIRRLLAAVVLGAELLRLAQASINVSSTLK